MLEVLGDIFIFLLLQPMLNGLVFLYDVLFESMALAIIALTVIVRVAFYPLTLKQLKSSARMQALQPQMQEIRNRFKNNPQLQQRETMKMYREAGVSPLGCLGPMVVQFPIWIGLYWAIIKGLGNLPGSFVYLSQRLYSWSPVGGEVLPLNTDMPWILGTLDLSAPDPTPLMPLLVAASTWAQQRIMQPPAMSDQQRQQQQIMLFLFPIMLGFLAFTFPSGLALYWFVSNFITIALQGFVSGWGNLLPGRPRLSLSAAAPQVPQVETRSENESESGMDGEVSRGSDSARTRRARSRSRRRRRRRS